MPAVEWIDSAKNTVCLKRMLHTSISKSAPSGRFFMPLIMLLGLLLGPFARSESTACASTHFHEKANIKKVIDGDTVVLTDERHVRLVGIDTPEIYHDGRPAEAGAVKARQQLQTLMTGTRFIGLRRDAERQDRHGRTLAHLFLPDGTNVQAALLADGLAMPLFIPPSILYAECYAGVAASARSAGNGLWSLPEFQPLPVKSLGGDERGFHILRGKVRYLSDSRSAVWINLENNVALRITRPDLPYFPDDFFNRLPGQNVEARGWLYERNDQLRMRLRFPLDLSIIETE